MHLASLSLRGSQQLGNGLILKCVNYIFIYVSAESVFKSNPTVNIFCQTILTCLSEMVMLGIAQEKFYNQMAVFTTSLAKLGEHFCFVL